jgi:hypothetical protein
VTVARGRVVLAGTVLFALLVAPVALAAANTAEASSSQSPPGGVAAGSSTGTWVGFVDARNSRAWQREDGVTDENEGKQSVTARASYEGKLTVTARADGATAIASRRVLNVFPDPDAPCPATYSEAGDFNGAVSPPTVSIFPDRYRVDYSASGGITPLIDVTIFEQHRDCRQETRTGQSRVLNVYIPIEGPATPNMTRVSGSLSRTDADCPSAAETQCLTTAEASWDLHLAGAIGGQSWPRQWGRGWRREGRPRTGRRLPGAGCWRSVIPGTSGDDELVGTSRGELMLGLAGNDRIAGRGGNDCLFGDSGDDVLLGGPGDDLLLGGWGNDVLNGGPGNDMLIAGRGRNKIIGGKGNDLILARNKQRDAIRCGPGFDIVIADRKDRVAKDCQVVRRR